MVNLHDKALIKKRFARHIDSYEIHATIQRTIAEVLASKTAGLLPDPCNSVLEIGCGTGFFTRALLEKTRIHQLYLNDLVEEAVDYTAKKLLSQDPDLHVFSIPGDAESVCFPQNLDAMVSASAMQWFDDPASFFRKISRNLSTGAGLAFNLFGSDNLYQVKELTGSGLDYPSPENLKKWLLPYFEIKEISEQWIHSEFASPMEILRHLQQTGVTGTRNFRWTRETLRNFEKTYRDRYTLPNGNVDLTWHILYITGKKHSYE